MTPDEIEAKSRQRAVDEIIALKARYAGKTDLIYRFEHAEKEVSGAFVTASLQAPPKPPNAYRIELLAPRETIVRGQAFITDTKGTKIVATAVTRPQGTENRIVLEALALE